MSDYDSVLHLKHCGKTGLYREAMRYYFMRRVSPHQQNQLETIQYAVALQHYGRYFESLDIYKETILKCEHSSTGLASSGISMPDLIYNLKLQTAVAFERLHEVDKAVSILDEIGDPDGHADLEIAAASLTSWYFLTRLKCHMLLGQHERVRHYCNVCIEHCENHRLLGDWSRLYLTLLDINNNSAISKLDLEIIELCIENVGKYDPPGQPWLGLVAGQHIIDRAPNIASQLLKKSEQQSSILGKYYLIGVINELLAQCYKSLPGASHNIELIINRALLAYDKCHLLTAANSKIRDRLLKFCLSLGQWNDTDVMNKFLQAIGTERMREEFIFAQMCQRQADILGIEAHKAFELFVSDWAATRFFGRRIGEPTGQPTADSIIVREISGKRLATVVQAKHYKYPKKSIPQNGLYLRELMSNNSIDKIERYVFVVSTSTPSGWHSRMWDYETERKIRNLIPDTEIEVIIVTEPELQTDVALSDALYIKYFSK